MAEDDDDHRDLVRLAVVGGGGGGGRGVFKLASRAGVLGLSRGQRARFRALYEELGAARMARKPWTAIWTRMKAGDDALSVGGEVAAFHPLEHCVVHRLQAEVQVWHQALFHRQ